MKTGTARFPRLGASVQASAGRQDGREALERLCRETGARFAADCLDEQPLLASGLAGLDDSPWGGLPCHGLVEVVEEGPATGGTLLLHQLLERACVERCYAALVDTADGFAPAAAREAVLRHLYWVRCRKAEEALRTADLLARDPNFLLLLLDLRGMEPEAFRRTPGRYWYRLQRALRGSRCCGLVLSPFPLVKAASPRLRIEGRFSLPDVDGGSREVLAAGLGFESLNGVRASGHA